MSHRYVEFDYNNSVMSQNGWQKYKTSSPVETIFAELRISDFKRNHGFDHERLKDEFSKQISKEIVDLINIEKKKQDFTDTTIYKAEVHIVREPKIKNYIMDKEQFVWEDKVWSQDEIIKALQIAYPQYSI